MLEGPNVQPVHQQPNTPGDQRQQDRDSHERTLRHGGNHHELTDSEDGLGKHHQAGATQALKNKSLADKKPQ